MDPRLRKIRTLNISTPVPIPDEVPLRIARIPRWLFVVIPILIAVFAFTAIRGNEPTTVIVSGGSVTPVDDINEEVFVQTGTYRMIDPTTGDQLDVCEWDYCVVQSEIGEFRIEQFAYTIDLDEALAIVEAVTESLDLSPVTVQSEDLQGDLGGYYDPSTDSITLDEPIVTWTVIHEVAHHIVHEQHGAEAWSHGPEFLETLDALVGP